MNALHNHAHHDATSPRNQATTPPRSAARQSVHEERNKRPSPSARHSKTDVPSKHHHDASLRGWQIDRTRQKADAAKAKKASPGDDGQKQFTGPAPPAKASVPAPPPHTTLLNHPDRFNRDDTAASRGCHQKSLNQSLREAVLVKVVVFVDGEMLMEQARMLLC